MTIRFLLSALAASSFSLAIGSDVDDPGSFSDRTDELVNDVMETVEIIPGVSIAVVAEGKPVLVRGYGFADLEKNLQADGDTIYYIASATKPFTALMAMILERRGEVDLESSVLDYLEGTWMDKNLEPDLIQLKDLLCHTSGLTNGPMTMRLAYTGDHSSDVLWKVIQATRANQSGRGRFQYTNYGYNLLTLLLERDLDKPWQDMLQDEIFTPLGLTHTSPRAGAVVWSIPQPISPTTSSPGCRCVNGSCPYPFLYASSWPSTPRSAGTSAGSSFAPSWPSSAGERESEGSPRVKPGESALLRGLDPP